MIIDQQKYHTKPLTNLYMSPAEWIRQAKWIKIANIIFFLNLLINQINCTAIDLFVQLEIW